MDKAYNPTTWENRPSTASPLDEINLNLLSQGVSTIDDRVIALDSTVGNSVQSVVTNEQTGLITVTLNDGTSYTYNPATKIYNTIAQNQQATQQSFADIAVDFQDVHSMLDAMDTKIDLTAEGANRGITNLQTTITQNDGYYRQEMSGIRTDVQNVADYVDATNQTTNQRVTQVYSSITQTTEAIQLSVTELSESVDGDIERLQSQITTTAGQISLKVSKLEVIDDLQHEFGSGIEITPDRITFASTGAMVVNTDNFKLDRLGNAEFKGHVAMDSGSVGGVPIIPSPSDSDSTLSVQHAHHSWKLRSAAISGTDERYYTYMTANKRLIVTNSETGGHSSSNDVTGNCTIGSPNYPWKVGYFYKLRTCTVENDDIVRHDVIPEGLRMTLLASDWVQVMSGYPGYKMNKTINGIKPGKTFLSIAVDNYNSFQMVYAWRVEVACIENNKIVFLCFGDINNPDDPPPNNMDVILLAEDYILPVPMDAPVLEASFDDENQILTCSWSTPEDSSRFHDWIGDYLIIEKYNETTGEWETEGTFPSDGHFNRNQFDDDKLIIGEVEENG